MPGEMAPTAAVVEAQRDDLSHHQQNQNNGEGDDSSSKDSSSVVVANHDDVNDDIEEHRRIMSQSQQLLLMLKDEGDLNLLPSKVKSHPKNTSRSVMSSLWKRIKKNASNNSSARRVKTKGGLDHTEHHNNDQRTLSRSSNQSGGWSEDAGSSSTRLLLGGGRKSRSRSRSRSERDPDLSRDRSNSLKRLFQRGKKRRGSKKNSSESSNNSSSNNNNAKNADVLLNLTKQQQQHEENLSEQQQHRDPESSPRSIMEQVNIEVPKTTDSSKRRRSRRKMEQPQELASNDMPTDIVCTLDADIDVMEEKSSSMRRSSISSSSTRKTNNGNNQDTMNPSSSSSRRSEAEHVSQAASPKRRSKKHLPGQGDDILLTPPPRRSEEPKRRSRRVIENSVDFPSSISQKATTPLRSHRSKDRKYHSSRELSTERSRYDQKERKHSSLREIEHRKPSSSMKKVRSSSSQRKIDSGNEQGERKKSTRQSSRRLLQDVDDEHARKPASTGSNHSCPTANSQPTSLWSMRSFDNTNGTNPSSTRTLPNLSDRTCGRHAKIHQRSKFGKSLQPTIAKSILFRTQKPMRSRSRSRTPLGRREAPQRSNSLRSITSISSKKDVDTPTATSKAVQYWINENYDESHRRRRSRSRSQNRRSEDESNSLGYSEPTASSKTRRGRKRDDGRSKSTESRSQSLEFMGEKSKRTSSSSSKRRHRSSSGRHKSSSSSSRKKDENRRSSRSHRRRERVPIHSVSLNNGSVHSPSSIATDGLAGDLAQKLVDHLPDPPVAVHHESQAAVPSPPASITCNEEEKKEEESNSAASTSSDSNHGAKLAMTLPASLPEPSSDAQFTIESLLDEDDEHIDYGDDGLASFSSEYEPYEVGPAPSIASVSGSQAVTAPQIALGIREDSTDDDEDDENASGAFPTFSSLEQNLLNRPAHDDDNDSCSSSSTVSSWSSFALPFEDDSSDESDDDDDVSVSYTGTASLLKTISDGILNSVHEAEIEDDPDLAEESTDILSPLKIAKHRFAMPFMTSPSKLTELSLPYHADDCVSLLESPITTREERPPTCKWEPSTPPTPMDQPVRTNESCARQFLNDDISLLTSPSEGQDDQEFNASADQSAPLMMTLPFQSDNDDSKSADISVPSSSSSSTSSSTSSSCCDDNEDCDNAADHLFGKDASHAPSTATSVTADSSNADDHNYHMHRCVRKLGLEEFPAMISHS